MHVKTSVSCEREVKRRGASAENTRDVGQAAVQRDEG